MSTKILIPTALRVYAGHQNTVELEGENIGELLENLANQFPQLKKNLFKEDGQLRNFVNIYVNEDDIRDLCEATAGHLSDDEVLRRGLDRLQGNRADARPS